MEAAFPDVVWMIVAGFILSFILSFALGANDVANSFGTAVGSKALTLLQACVLATIFETLGAILLGAKVSDTIRKGLFDVGLYEDNPLLLMVGQISALTAASVWLLVATALKLPVSGTHSTVGAMLGFHLVAFGTEGVEWKEIILIVCSWVISPLLAGSVSSLIFIAFRKYVMDKEEPLEPGLRSLPFLYCVVLIINVFSIFYEGPGALGELMAWVVLLIAFGTGFLVGTLVWLIYVPRVRQTILGYHVGGELTTVSHTTQTEDEDFYDNLAMSELDVSSIQEAGEVQSNNVEKSKSMTVEADANKEKILHDDDDQSKPTELDVNEVKKRTSSTVNRHADDPEWSEVKDHPHVTKICLPLQVLSSIFGAFAHGGNDISNAIGPFVALWVIYTTGDVQQEEDVDTWILVYGSIGVSVGLWVLGKRVIETVGDDLTPLTVSSAFTIELGSATTVLVASNLGIPVSTTHCKVGSIVAVGWVRTRTAVDWTLFYSIIAAWVITLPVTVGISAFMMFLLQKTV